MEARITHGLIIRTDPLSRILGGTKTWEIRGHRTRIRGVVGLIEAGTGCVVGTARLVDVVGPMSESTISRRKGKTGYSTLPVSYCEYFAWVLESARRLPSPVRYRHPSGAVVWVRIADAVADAIHALG